MNWVLLRGLDNKKPPLSFLSADGCTLLLSLSYKAAIRISRSLLWRYCPYPYIERSAALTVSKRFPSNLIRQLSLEKAKMSCILDILLALHWNGSELIRNTKSFTSLIVKDAGRIISWKENYIRMFRSEILNCSNKATLPITQQAFHFRKSVPKTDISPGVLIYIFQCGFIEPH